jgi:hypothetical protein
VSDWPTFVDGEAYTWEQIAPYTWTASGHRRDVDIGARFRCSKPPGAAYAVFDEIVGESPYSLVSAQEVVDAVEELRSRGLDPRAIARASGISEDSAHRAIAGHGQIRRSTAAALRAAAHGAGTNGKKGPLDGLLGGGT